MSKTGKAVAKLMDKSKARAVRLKLGTFNAVIARTRSSFHEKAVAFEAHRRLIQTHAINLGPRVTYLAKSDKDKRTAVTFRGDGLPDDSVTGVVVAKTNAERAAEDERAPLKSEWKAGWRPGKFGRCYS